MKRNVIVFGLISGGIISAFMAISMAIFSQDELMESGMLVGYAAMLVSFSFVFIGIRNYREKYNGGVITFGQAFKTGLYITLIASTLYVAVWLVEYYMFIPDFMEKYSANAIKHIQESGASQIEIEKKIADMNKYKEMYENPLFVILLTYAEILPIGILFTLVSSLILKKKPASQQMEMAG